MGELFEKGQSRPATPDDLALYERAQSMQALQEVPLLQRSDNPHEYLFFALFDGTGQDADNPEQELTNVGHLYKQSEELARNPDNRIGYKYVEGIGTQTSPVTRYADAWVPYTWDDKIEKAYRALANQAKEWKERDPEAQIRVAEIGYSRGAVLAPGLARLVDKYGIADPENLRFGRNEHGNLTVESPHPPLVAPGQVAQALGLYDPVATNMPGAYDARRAPSVISATALAARDEDRVKFPHQTILEPGLSPDRRFANLLVPGGHSNVGGGNRDHGLEAGSFNVMADYLNALRDKPLFQYRPLPGDPNAYTVYQAHGPTAVPGMDQDALRDLRAELANCRIVDPCREGEPVNRALADQFEYRRLQPAAPVPTLAPLQRQDTARDASPAEQSRKTPLPPSDPAHPDHGMLEQIRAGVHGLGQQDDRIQGENSERVSRSLLAASKDNRDLRPGAGNASLSANALTRADHVVMGEDGRYIFAVQGDLYDPAHRRAAVEVEQAVRIPVEQSDAKLDAANRQIAQELQLAQQQELQRQQDTPARNAPGMH